MGILSSSLLSLSTPLTHSHSLSFLHTHKHPHTPLPYTLLFTTLSLNSFNTLTLSLLPSHTNIYTPLYLILSSSLLSSLNSFNTLINTLSSSHTHTNTHHPM